jgi:hypothetical protein
MAARKKHVTLAVSTDLLEQILRLDPSMHIVSADVDEDKNIATFKLRAPNAPNGAFAMIPEYVRAEGEDPISLRAVTWVYPGGRTATTEFGQAQKEAA